MRANIIFTALAAAVCSVSAASVEKRQSLARVVTSCVKANTAALTFVCWIASLLSPKDSRRVLGRRSVGLSVS